MRIVFMITVGAFLLSISIADSEMPIGAPQYLYRQTPYILEPVLKTSSGDSDNPIKWFIDMVSRALKPSKKPPPPPPPLVGPIKLPGLGGHIYIRQLENDGLPWEKSHLVIKMLTRDPDSGNALPMDSSSFHHRQEDPSRRAANSFGHRSKNNVVSRPQNNFFQPGFVPISPTSRYSSWNAQQQQQQQQPHHNNHRHRYNAGYNNRSPTQPQLSKPFRPSPPNDFYHDNYGKETVRDDDHPHQRPYRMSHHSGFDQGQGQPSRALPMASSSYRTIAHESPNIAATDPIDDYSDRSKSTRNTDIQNDYYGDGGKTDLPTVTQLSYPEYPSGVSDDDPEASAKFVNVSHVERTSAKPAFVNFVGYDDQAVRNDRRAVAPTDGHRNNFNRDASGDRKSKSLPTGSNARGSRRGTGYDAKFDARDVGGIEVIDAPNLRSGVWKDYNGATSVEDDVRPRTDSRESESSMESNGNPTNVIGVENKIEVTSGRSAVDNSNRQVDGQTEESFVVPVARPTHQSKRLSHRFIDRLHGNSPGNDGRTDFSNGSQQRIIDDTNITQIGNKLKINNSGEKASGESERNAKKTDDVTARVVQKVINGTIGKNSLTQGRIPRVVKAIYRRKPVARIMKTSAESVESSVSSVEVTSDTTSSAKKS